MMPILPVNIESQGKSICTNTLLDVSSDTTVVTTKITEKLQLKGPTETIVLLTASGRSSSTSVMHLFQTLFRHW